MYCVVYVTVPNSETAETIARALVSEKLAACANVVPGLTSIYFWEGAVHQDPELLLIIKTRQTLFDQLAARVKALHPYTVPEIISLPVQQGSQDYLEWIGASTKAAE